MFSFAHSVLARVSIQGMFSVRVGSVSFLFRLASIIGSLTVMVFEEKHFAFAVTRTRREGDDVVLCVRTFDLVLRQDRQVMGR